VFKPAFEHLVWLRHQICWSNSKFIWYACSSIDKYLFQQLLCWSKSFKQAFSWWYWL